MHIASCINPQRIKNPYTGIVQMVPCGKCDACRNRAASIWVQRLEQERYCWKYCWFFTLTYNPENVPTLCLSNRILYPCDNSHISPTGNLPIINIDDLYSDSRPNEVRRLNKFFNRFDRLFYVSKYDVQCFMKRLRITIKRLHDNPQKNILNEKDSKVRYFICSEYGPKGLPPRPHYHGVLFFNSSLTAAHIHQIISSCWKFGFVNSSPVSSQGGCKYVAQYLNCTTHLPKVYEHKYIRPFCLFSKCPPIGSLCHSTQEIRELFYSCSPSQVIANHSKNMFENVPLWRNYQDSLFPRLSYFSELSTADRITLYRVFQSFTGKYPEANSAQFYYYIKDAVCNIKNNVVPLCSTCLDYARLLLSKSDKPYAIQRWYNISSRVCEQARVFGVSLNEYVFHIEMFYSNCEKYNIRQLYEFEENYVEKYPVENLLGIDTLFLQSVLNVPLELLSAEEISILQSYHIDFDKFFSDNLTIRQQYYELLDFRKTEDYLAFKLDNECIRRNNSKTKEKNEFINPNIFGDF